MTRRERRLGRLLAGREVKAEVEDELDFHLEMSARELEASGVPPEEARRLAARRFGDVERVRRECRRIGTERERDMRRTRYFSELRQDIGFGLRQLRRTPAFAAVATLTLALGIGATTAIFSVVDGVLLRPLPFPEAERLIVPMSEHRVNGSRWNTAWPDYEDWRREGVFERVALFDRPAVTIAGDGDPERVRAARVTEEFFGVLGLRALIGRLPGAELFRPEAPRTVVLSHGLWQRQFGGRQDIVGEVLQVSGMPMEVVAVLPPAVEYPQEAELWVADRRSPADNPYMLERDNYAWAALARLKEGASLESTRTELAALARRAELDNPQERTDVTITAVPLPDYVLGEDLPRVLWIFLGAVVLVLLIACVNVANLLLGRSAERVREFAVRTAMGAARGRLVRQLLTESAVLGLAGGALGTLLAYGGVRALVAAAPASVPRLDTVAVDERVLAAALAISLLSALVFGLAPAVQLSRRARGLAGEGMGQLRTRGHGGGRRGREALVAAELALSLLLLVGAGLFARSFVRLAGTDPGFRTERLLTFRMALTGDRYDPDEVVIATVEDMLEELRALPGVVAASATGSLPVGGGGGGYLIRAFLPEGRPEPPEGHEVTGPWIVMTPGHFETLGIPLLRGRALSPEDGAEAPPVAVVSRAFAREMFGDESEAVGKRVRSWRDENLYREVVGVVDDVRVFGAADSIRPTFYVTHAQNAWSGFAVVVRTATPPEALIPQVRAVVRRTDPALALSNVRTMEDIFAESVSPQRFAAGMMGVFALAALLLAAVGLYGVLSYLVAHRTREIGVRMALGAGRGEVLGMVMREAGLVVAAGAAVGLLGAFALSRVISAVLYEVSATDPAVFVGVPLFLAAIALLASWLPARRAAAVDPAVAMRAE